MDPCVDALIEQAKADETVLAIILFGSRARGDSTAKSDIDLCLVLAPDKDSTEERLRIRLTYLPDEQLDLRIFQQLPLYIRRRVVKEGVVLYCRNLDRLYELTHRTAKAFERFRPHYERYLREIQHAGS